MYQVTNIEVLIFSSCAQLVYPKNPLDCTQSPLGTTGPQDKVQCDKLGILGPSKYLNLSLEKSRTY